MQQQGLRRRVPHKGGSALWKATAKVWCTDGRHIKTYTDRDTNERYIALQLVAHISHKSAAWHFEVSNTFACAAMSASAVTWHSHSVPQTFTNMRNSEKGAHPNSDARDSTATTSSSRVFSRGSCVMVFSWGSGR